MGDFLRFCKLLTHVRNCPCLRCCISNRGEPISTGNISLGLSHFFRSFFLNDLKRKLLNTQIYLFFFARKSDAVPDWGSKQFSTPIGVSLAQLAYHCHHLRKFIPRSGGERAILGYVCKKGPV